jgi:PPOX class probable F420-dependent enzyme
MAPTLTDAHKGILDKKVFAFVTTLNPDGSPQTTPVWVDHDGERIRFNTDRSRIKIRNLERDPRVSVAMVDPDDPYTGVLVVRGTTRLIDEGADDHIDRLTKKYTGQDRFPWRTAESRRVTVEVVPDRITDSPS